jgi:AcrR family transcriptional regulator
MASVKDPQRRTYGGRTGDERAAGRRGALVEAAFALVAETGWRELSIEAVCRRAGLNKRYFYESFRDLDELTGAVIASLAEEAIAVTLAALDHDASRAQATYAGVGALVRHLTDDPRRARVLFGAVPAGDAAAGHRAVAIREVIATVAAEGRSFYGLVVDPAIELTAAMLVGGTSQAVLDWLDGRIDCSREQLVDDLAALWFAVGEATSVRIRARPG